MAKECDSKTCDKSSCEGCASKKNPQSMQAAMNAMSNVKHVIGIVSGKGGVGKSFVTASLANRMAKKGYKVGILDADITGPSIPKMYGLKGAAQANDSGIFPMETKNGIKVMSINLLLPTEDTPVIWRGPILGNMVKQFWTDVIWGDVDYLFVDMPPGTGDVPLTVFPVPSDPGNRDRNLSTGSCKHDREEGIQYGWNDEDAGSGSCRELQLCEMSKLRQRAESIRRKSH